MVEVLRGRRGRVGLDTRLPLFVQGTPTPDVAGTVSTLAQIGNVQSRTRLNELLGQKAQQEQILRAQGLARGQEQQAIEQQVARQFQPQQGTLAALGAPQGAPAAATPQTLGDLVDQGMVAPPEQPTVADVGQPPRPGQPAPGEPVLPDRFAQHKAVERALEARGFFDRAAVIREQRLGAEALQLNANKVRLENSQEQAEQAGRILSGIQSVPEARRFEAYRRELPRLRETARRMGIDPLVHYPDEYDPVIVSQRLVEGQGMKDRIASLTSQVNARSQALRAEAARDKEAREAAAAPAEAALAERQQRTRERQATTAERREMRLEQGLTPVVQALSQGARDRLAAQGLLQPGTTPSQTQLNTAVKEAQDERVQLRREEARARFGEQGLPATTITALGDIEDVRGAMETMRQHLRPEFVGFFQGPAGRVRARVTGQEQAPGETEFRQAAALAMEAYARARSGAAINRSEMRNFERQIPAEGDSFQQIMDKIAGMNQFLGRQERRLVGVSALTREEAARRMRAREPLFPEGAPNVRAITPTSPQQMSNEEIRQRLGQ